MPQKRMRRKLNKNNNMRNNNIVSSTTQKKNVVFRAGANWTEAHNMILFHNKDILKQAPWNTERSITTASTSIFFIPHLYSLKSCPAPTYFLTALTQQRITPSLEFGTEFG